MKHTWIFSVHPNSKALVAEERPGPLDTSCWVVTSHVPCGNGYIFIGFNPRQLVYRAVYEREVGPIPEGLIIRHRCDNPKCVNPDHLLTGTKQDNTQDMINRKRHKYGEKASWSKLNEISVRFIRQLEKAPGIFAYLACLLNVSEATIRDAYYGRTWRHLNENNEPNRRKIGILYR